MKHLTIVFIVLLTTISCSKSDDKRDDNPNLIDPLVSLNLSLSLPEYSPLNFPGNSVIINQQGIKGIIIYNVNNDLYTAFDLSDPNHPPNSCSRMNVEVPLASCPCGDGNEYNIISGEHTTNNSLYPMQRYQAVRTGNTVRVSN